MWKLKKISQYIVNNEFSMYFAPLLQISRKIFPQNFHEDVISSSVFNASLGKGKLQCSTENRKLGRFIRTQQTF